MTVTVTMIMTGKIRYMPPPLGVHFAQYIHKVYQKSILHKFHTSVSQQEKRQNNAWIRKLIFRSQCPGRFDIILTLFLFLLRLTIKVRKEMEILQMKLNKMCILVPKYFKDCSPDLTANSDFLHFLSKQINCLVFTYTANVFPIKSAGNPRVAGDPVICM